MGNFKGSGAAVLRALSEMASLRITIAATLRNQLREYERVKVSQTSPYRDQLQNELDQLSEAIAVLTIPTATTRAMQRLEDEVAELRDRLDEFCSASEDPPHDPVGLAGAGAGEGAGGFGGDPTGADADSVSPVAPSDQD